MTLGGLTTTIDPSEIYYTDTSSIMSGLVTRSLTQYKYDPDTKQMVLVPDLATDLGHAQRQLHQVDLHHPSRCEVARTARPSPPRRSPSA